MEHEVHSMHNNLVKDRVCVAVCVHRRTDASLDTELNDLGISFPFLI